MSRSSMLSRLHTDQSYLIPHIALGGRRLDPHFTEVDTESQSVTGRLKDEELVEAGVEADAGGSGSMASSTIHVR